MPDTLGGLLRELVKQPNKDIIVYFDHFNQFKFSDLHEYLRVNYANGRCEPLEDNGTRVSVCLSSQRAEQFAGILPDYVVVKGQAWEQWEGREMMIRRLQRTGGTLIYDQQD